MITPRWEGAQHAEKRYWKSRDNWINDGQSNEKYWAEMLRYGFGIDYDFFLDKDVLEIGCGPAGVIFSLKNTKSRTGLEPMDLNEFIKEDWKKGLVRQGVGENMPFENNSFDIVLCFNALDHCLDPDKVIHEIHRVLREGAEFLLWLHVLRNQYKFLESFLNKIDSPHPNHFTVNDVLTLINPQFEIKDKKIFSGLGPVASSNVSVPAKKNLKVLVGNWMMNDLWLRLGKI
jgi:SAM-dependent methyltransferase